LDLGIDALGEGVVDGMLEVGEEVDQVSLEGFLPGIVCVNRGRFYLKKLKENELRRIWRL
jgi:hypothetical protein